MTITTEQLAALEAALEKADAGEWAYRWNFDDIRSETGYIAECEEHNAIFIALAHNLMPGLIAAAKEAERLRDRLRCAVHNWHEAERHVGELKAERDAAFAAGRKAGMEEAAKKVRAMSAKFYPHAKAPYDDMNDAILALIEKEKADG